MMYKIVELPKLMWHDMKQYKKLTCFVFIEYQSLTRAIHENNY